MNHRELDRLLCERLGIAPESTSRHEYWDHRGDPCGCTCGARIDLYPRLSTTGEGMLALMEALRFYGYFAQIVARDKRSHRRALDAQRCVAESRFTARIGASIFAGNVGHVLSEVERESAPLALALAAASELGIEVPE